ncbi:MAG: carboxypeptidase regulatory-like domain-containing protein [Polyangiaceae bacterium]
MRIVRPFTAVILALGGLLGAASCGSSEDPTEFPVGTADGGGGGGGGDGGGGGGFGFQDAASEASRPCVGLECQQVACAGGGTTTVSGKVLAPEGTVPLYNAIVYVPNSKPEGFKEGVVCEQCGQVTGSPVVTALTNEKGEFVLQNVPVGSDIPLVVQIGKWRRQVTIPKVEKCVDTKVDGGLTRLPRSQAEGDIPRIAITSGSADSLECFLRKLGIADSEFTPPTGTGRVHFYQGNGSRLASGTTPAAQTLWGDSAALKKYDMTVLSCEGDERTGDKQAHYAKMKDYLDSGGKVFASHFHYVWFRYGTAPLPTAATWSPAPSTSNPYQIDTDFPKGNAFADWLQNVGATTTRGQIDLSQVRNSIGDSAPAVSRRWIRSDNPKTAKYFSFNAPIGQPVDKQCGRGVFTDVHVSGSGGATFPSFCNSSPLSANEKALIFLFFDLSSCVGDDSKPPVPPPAIPK